MSSTRCAEELPTKLPALVDALHSGGASAIHISHQVDARGDCELTIEVVGAKPVPGGETPRDETWEYRWP